MGSANQSRYDMPPSFSTVLSELPSIKAGTKVRFQGW